MKKSLIYFALSILSANLTYARDVKITQPVQVAAVEEDEMFVEEEQDFEEADLEDFDET
jgi:hypothetical protein